MALSTSSADAAQRKALASVRVKQPQAVTRAAKFVMLRGTARGSYTRTLTVQRKVKGTWRKVKTFKAAKSWQVSVKLAAVPSTFRVRAGTKRGPVASNRVTVKLKATPVTPNALPLDAHDAQRNTILLNTNTYRARFGLPPLKPMASLDKIATAWSVRQAARRTMSHNPTYWLSYPSGWRACGENVAYGYPIRTVVSEWIGSPPHRLNLLGDWTHIGIGYAVDSAGVPYYTQNFGKF